MKKIVPLFLLTLILSSCSILYPNYSSNNQPNEEQGSFFEPWDKLGGGKEATVGSEENIKNEDYSSLELNIDSKQLNESKDTTNSINLNSITTLPSGVSFASGKLSITKGGTYYIEGSLKGNIFVDTCSNQDVRLILSNVNITSENANAPISFKKSEGHRIITVLEGTTSTLTDSSKNVGDTSDGSIIEAKSCKLTINGKGNLILESKSSSSTGIECKESLSIINTKIDINATNHGIKVDEIINIKDANIKIKSGNDGIKNDITPTTLDNAKTLASSLDNGVINIISSSIDLDVKDDGISATSMLYIKNSENDLINIKTNGGAPSKITEATSDSSNGKAIRVEGIKYINGTTETKVSSTHENNYSLIIDGGKFNLNSNNDAISSQGNVIINDGTYVINSGDDGIHSEYTTTIRGGNINIESSYEGIEGAGVEIYGGNISLYSIDDGINASNSEISGYDNHILIRDGNIEVNADGDGVDSNGWIKVDGGTLSIYGPISGMNGSLDSDKGILVENGDIIALGSRGMVETPAKNSTQPYININLSSAVSSVIEVLDSDSNSLIKVTPNKKYQSVVLTLDSFELDKTYYVVVGETTYEAKLTNVGTALGTNSSGNNNQGFMPGGRPPKR